MLSKQVSKLQKVQHAREFVKPLMVTAIGGSAVAMMLCFYRIAKADQYLIRTGLGIKDIKVSKKGFVLPYVHQYKFINMHPQNYEFSLHAMSVEKIPFILPGFFTIGPKNDEESLIKYVRFLAGGNINEIISGILEGETRTLSSKMTMEEIFNDRQTFKETIIKGVQEELDQFGLIIFNSNIKELIDSEESKYFHNMMQKKASSVENEAKIAVSEANKMGNIGHKQREAETRQQISLLEANTIRKENDNQKDIQLSKSELLVVTAETEQIANIAKIQSDSNASICALELQKTIEQRRLEADTLKEKATLLPKTIAEAESMRLLAEAKLYAQQQEAFGVQALLDAQSAGIHKLSTSFNNDYDAMMQYVMVNQNLFEKIADANARAVQGLKPNINVFSSQGTNSEQNPISDIFKMSLPLVMSYLNKQTSPKNK